MMATRAQERARGHATPLPSPLLTRGPLRTEHAPCDLTNFLPWTRQFTPFYFFSKSLFLFK